MHSILGRQGSDSTRRRYGIVKLGRVPGGERAEAGAEATEINGNKSEVNTSLLCS
jgi:hypothetical protein